MQNQDKTPLEKAINSAGSQVLLAEMLGVTPQAVQQWKKSNKVPAERVISVERITGVSRHDIRPDIYPRESAA
ncbi:transcriptional regulator [Tolumonas lignilytica]|uniref:transcriptional regulator n=1 Tax=Tolumonas lignilytica TaxID=1283284 RepID=UPI0004664E23|nr:Cro/CI family transcriptional regulator [Tolumonas lignilytica]